MKLTRHNDNNRQFFVRCLFACYKMTFRSLIWFNCESWFRLETADLFWPELCSNSCSKKHRFDKYSFLVVTCPQLFWSLINRNPIYHSSKRQTISRTAIPTNDCNVIKRNHRNNDTKLTQFDWIIEDSIWI